MLATKLILIEGLPGSGKSTTAQRLTRQLQRHGVTARWFGEQEEPHPTNIAGASTIERFIQQTIDQWQEFVTATQAAETVTVLEGSLFQSFIRVMFHHNVEPARILDYGYQLEAIVRPLDPVLIYFRHTDIANALRNICDWRGQRWEQGFIATVTSKPYGLQHRLAGFAGTVRYWQAYQALTDRLFAAYRITKLGIETSDNHWPHSLRRIYGFLSIPPLPEPTVPAAYQEKVAGVYRDEIDQHEVVVRSEDGEVVIDNFIWATAKLLPHGSHTFDIEGWPFELTFEEDATGVVQRATIGGRNVDFLTLVGRVLTKQQSGGPAH